MAKLRKTAFNVSRIIYYRILLVTVSLFALDNASAQAPNISYQTPNIYNTNTLINILTPSNTGGSVPAMAYGQINVYAGGVFNNITDVVADNNGNIYVTDWYANKIMKVSNSGIISVFAGSGINNSTDGLGIAAGFNGPQRIAIDQAGNLYVTDNGSLIRKITPAGLVTTLAGNPIKGNVDGVGAAASFNYPTGISVDSDGNLYVADVLNSSIRKVTPAGLVTTLTGGMDPNGTAVDAAGNIYVADSFSGSIKKITPGGVVTIFATGFTMPRVIRIDDVNNLFVTDHGNTIKKVSQAGIVTTLPGIFGTLFGLALDGTGNLFIVDQGSNNVKKMSLYGYTIDKTLPAGLVFDATTGSITGTPTVASPATDYTITAYNVSGNSTTVVKITVNGVTPLIQSIITIPVPVNNNIDASNILNTGAISNNNETPITFTSNNPAVAYIGPDGLIHVIAPGTVKITANQAGNSNYLAAAPVEQTYVIKQAQVINFPIIISKLNCEGDFASNIQSSNPTLPITYTSSNPLVATISAQGLIHITGVGTTVITASQNGDALFIAAVSQSRTFTVNLPATPSVIIAANYTSICPGLPVTFTATINNTIVNPSYQWQINGINVGSNNSTYITPVINTDLIKCIVTNNDACTATSTSNIISGITTTPYITSAISLQSSATGAVCSGTNIMFTAITLNAGLNPTYQWLINGINTGTNSPIFTSTGLANGDIITCKLTNNDPGACLTIASVTSAPLTVNITIPATPAPSVTIIASTDNVYSGTAITFTATPHNAGGITAFQWQINGINTGTSSPIFTTSRLNNASQITCTITSVLPCTVPATSQALTMTILAPPTVHIPNGFTPNGDGINDKWDIPDLVFYPNNTVKIYNRYGTLIYTSKGYNTPWDGSFNNSVLPVSSYYYIIDLGNQTKALSGYVTIIK